MLDTDIVSDVIRHPHGAVARHFARVGETGLRLSVIAAAKLRYGAVKSGSPRLQERVDAVLARIPVLPLAPPADAAYARIRAVLTSSGMPIGPTDLLIAAHAIAADATLVTANLAEFARVPGLALENWLG